MVAGRTAGGGWLTAAAAAANHNKASVYVCGIVQLCTEPRIHSAEMFFTLREAVEQMSEGEKKAAEALQFEILNKITLRRRLDLFAEPQKHPLKSHPSDLKSLSNLFVNVLIRPS